MHEVAIPAGMKPWAGGDGAPEDWDGGAVLLRDGGYWYSKVAWWHSPGGDLDGGRDIIAYTPRTATPASEDAAGDAIRAVTAKMRRIMPNACGDWADEIDAALTLGKSTSSSPQIYAVADDGLFCRHCGKASWLHYRVKGEGNLCLHPNTGEIISRLEAALEWALDQAASEHPHYPERALPRTAYSAWQYPYLMSGPVQGGVCHASFQTALEAVEAAQQEKGA